MQFKAIIVACLAGMATAVPIHARSEAGIGGIIEPTPLCEFKRGVGCDNKRSEISEGFAEAGTPLTTLAEFKRHSSDLEETSEPSPLSELRQATSG
ncbi:hypothetical protein EAF04_002599 [Stromatinia cepivora]|nr:hypothetical protein EAF04_002599 [Stromatinia cepivora]